MTDTAATLSKLIHGRPGPWDIVMGLEIPAQVPPSAWANTLEDAAGFVARPETWR